MPFLGQDWRSPGDQWVKTTDGWHRMRLWRMRVLENLNENVLARIFRANQSSESQDRVENQSQPHVFLSRSSRETAIHMSLSEAFSKLDMSGAVRDLRRCNYVYKLLLETIKFHLDHLSGSAQRVIICLLEECVSQALRSHNNIRDLRQLLREAELALDRGRYYHVGSAQLWQQHRQTVDRLNNLVNDLTIRERSEDGGMTLTDLPDDCLREILNRLQDPIDIVSAGLTHSRTFGLTEESTLWRDLCVFHFGEDQIHSVLRRGETSVDDVGWKVLHARLVKRYGLRDMYADMLQLCKLCHALHWKHHGHPCLLPNEPPVSDPVSPFMCLQLFEA